MSQLAVFKLHSMAVYVINLGKMNDYLVHNWGSLLDSLIRIEHMQPIWRNKAFEFAKI